MIICQTDKSGKFAMRTREQYITAGTVHTCKDQEIIRKVSENIEMHINGHMRWWASISNLSADWNQQDRAVRNLLNHGLAVCPMALLIKDYKHFEIGDTPPSRSVMAGNVGGNKPLAKGMEGMEINASSGLINIIESINTDISRGMEHQTHWTSSNQEQKRARRLQKLLLPSLETVYPSLMMEMGLGIP